MSGEHACDGHDDDRGERPLSGAIALTAVIFVAELAGGWWTGSLALMADATHMAVDLLGLGLSLARKILRRLGGEISAVNGPSKGAIITLSLVPADSSPALTQ